MAGICRCQSEEDSNTDLDGEEGTNKNAEEEGGTEHAFISVQKPRQLARCVAGADFPNEC